MKESTYGIQLETLSFAKFVAGTFFISIKEGAGLPELEQWVVDICTSNPKTCFHSLLRWTAQIPQADLDGLHTPGVVSADAITALESFLRLRGKAGERLDSLGQTEILAHRMTVVPQGDCGVIWTGGLDPMGRDAILQFCSALNACGISWVLFDSPLP